MTPDRKPSTRQQLVVVLGMHRSGTSAIARSLQSLGVELGSELLPSAPNNNEKGFWEDKDLVALNAALMGAVGVEWDSLGAISEDALLSREVGILREEASHLLLGKLGDSERYGIKDPRLCRLLPFWKPVFQELDLDVRYVIANRNPLSVAASLQRRDEMAVEKGLLLWFVYTQSAFRHAWPHKPFVLDYDRLLENPPGQLERLAEFLNVPITDRIESAVKAYGEDFLEDRLRHAVFGFEEVMATPELPNCAKKIFEIITRLGMGSEPIDSRHIQDLIRQADEALTILEPAFVCIDKASKQRLSTIGGAETAQVAPPRNPIVTELVAYHAAKGGVYGETQTVRAPVFFDTGRQTIYIALPAGTRSMRIDPSTFPCVFMIHAAVWRNSAYEAIQTGGSGAEIGILGARDIVVRLSDGSRAKQELICFGNDPHFTAEIPPPVVALLETQTVVLELDIEARSIAESMSIVTDDLLGGLTQQFERTIQEVESRVSRLLAAEPANVAQHLQRVIDTCERLGQDVHVGMEKTLGHLKGLHEVLASQTADLSSVLSGRGAFAEALRSQAERHGAALDDLRERHSRAAARQDAAWIELREQHVSDAERHGAALDALSDTVRLAEGRVMGALSETSDGVRTDFATFGQALVARLDAATSVLEQVVTRSATTFTERVTNECRAEVARSTEQTANVVEKLNAALVQGFSEQTVMASRCISAIDDQLARMHSELDRERVANKNLALEREKLHHALEAMREKLQHLQTEYTSLSSTRGGRLLLRMYGSQLNISQEK